LQIIPVAKLQSLDTNGIISQIEKIKASCVEK
jgi:hypothetical protein